MYIFNDDTGVKKEVPKAKEVLLTVTYDDDDFDCDGDLVLDDGDYYEAVNLITN